MSATMVVTLRTAFHHLVHGGASLCTSLLPASTCEADSLISSLISLAAVALRWASAAHLRRHHGEAATLLTRAGSLHGRVQGEDVGLESNAVNDTNDVHDLAGPDASMTPHTSRTTWPTTVVAAWRSHLRKRQWPARWLDGHWLRFAAP